MENFRNWENKTGKTQNRTAFARYLGVKQPTLTRWMSGDNPPNYEHVKKLAEKLSYEIYDILGLTRPDEQYLELQRLYDETPKENKRELIKRVQEITKELGLKRTK